LVLVFMFFFLFALVLLFFWFFCQTLYSLCCWTHKNRFRSFFKLYLKLFTGFPQYFLKQHLTWGGWSWWPQINTGLTPSWSFSLPTSRSWINCIKDQSLLGLAYVKATRSRWRSNWCSCCPLQRWKVIVHFLKQMQENSTTTEVHRISQVNSYRALPLPPSWIG
jgi:hypothetical protein